MTLKVVHREKGNSSDSSDKGTFIIEATKRENKQKNIKGDVGYIADVNGKISVSTKLIPQVVRYSSYKEASKQVNHIESNINGLDLKILGQKKIEEILANQGDLDVVIPVNEVTGGTYIVGVYDTNTKETIGYMTYDPQSKKYAMKKDKSAVAFWEGKENVDGFIEDAKKLIANHPNLELKSEKIK